MNTAVGLSYLHTQQMAYSYTASQKHESTLFHTYVLNEIFAADCSCTTKVLKKLLKKLVARIFTLLLAPFGTFCVQIGQLVGAQWDFKL